MGKKPIEQDGSTLDLGIHVDRRIWLGRPDLPEENTEV